MLSFSRCMDKSACPVCDGFGLIECSECGEIGREYQFQPIDLGVPGCSKCKGFSYVICYRCEGSGEVGGHQHSQ